MWTKLKTAVLISTAVIIITSCREPSSEVNFDIATGAHLFHNGTEIFDGDSMSVETDTDLLFTYSIDEADHWFEDEISVVSYYTDVEAWIDPGRIRVIKNSYETFIKITTREDAADIIAAHESDSYVLFNQQNDTETKLYYFDGAAQSNPGVVSQTRKIRGGTTAEGKFIIQNPDLTRAEIFSPPSTKTVYPVPYQSRLSNDGQYQLDPDFRFWNDSTYITRFPVPPFELDTKAVMSWGFASLTSSTRSYIGYIDLTIWNAADTSILNLNRFSRDLVTIMVPRVDDFFILRQNNTVCTLFHYDHGTGNLSEITTFPFSLQYPVMQNDLLIFETRSETETILRSFNTQNPSNPVVDIFTTTPDNEHIVALGGGTYAYQKNPTGDWTRKYREIIFFDGSTETNLTLLLAP